MDYTILFGDTFRKLGFDVVGVWNAFDPPYGNEAGWPLKLPDVEFNPNTVLIMHFQDFVTSVDGRIVELDRVADHYGKHANQIVVTHMHPDLDKVYNGPINLIEFSNHNYALMQVLANRWTDWKHITEMPKTKGWQSLNGRMCQHRLRVADILKTWPNGMLSYGDAILLPEWAYSTYRGTENDDNFIRLADVYGSCAVNIVTETLYDPWPGLYCEKTLLAILAQQIPIIIGHRGIVQHLKSAGFDMFEDVVDTSYDSLPNEIRIEEALLRNKDLILGNVDLTPYQDRLKRNREYLLDDFPTWMELRFIRDCERLAQNLLQR